MTKKKLPVSVSRPELLDADGRDQAFRTLVYDLLSLGARMQEARDRLAKGIDVTGPQYAIVMAVAHMQDDEGGAGVRAVARRLHVSGPFITAQVNLLVKANLVAKHPNPEDGRGVSLRLTEQGEAQLEAMAPEIQRANDTFFGSLSVEDFRSLAEIVARLEASTELAVRTPAD
ncbi:MAG: MarR family transcriptional regulator [Rhodospirillaceae bacterium]|nr:MarR family transcriptional regulator [Rhodospirillaceae bacterium]RPG03149.1 MAG: MarR family transcriptional regulator [Rhodospirillaceae bacterium TMED63]RZO36682.1 MAG: MarR family transcriptional regulator [Rhodospirillaceae bacterium]